VSNLINSVNPINTGTDIKGQFRGVARPDRPYNQLSIFGWKAGQAYKNWEQLTQDQWVLLMMSGHQLELFQAPWQTKPMPEIPCSTDENINRDQDINRDQGLTVQGCNKGENTILATQIFWAEKKGGKDQS